MDIESIIEEEQLSKIEPLLIEKLRGEEIDIQTEFKVLIDLGELSEGKRERLREHEIEIIKEYPIGSILVETDIEGLSELLRDEELDLRRVSDTEGEIRLD